MIVVTILYRLVLNGYRSNDDLKDPRVSALLNKSLEGVPPCLFIVAELDPLRDGSFGMKEYNESTFVEILSFYFTEYQKLLEQAGVHTKLVLVKGVIHGFISVPGKEIQTFSFLVVFLCIKL
jgi:acetyl esterase/lipase